VGDDDLRRGIDRSLRIVALDVAVLGLEDAALPIGEVVLRLAIGTVRNFVPEAIVMERGESSHCYRERAY
jgi:hypothetical protein